MRDDTAARLGARGWQKKGKVGVMGKGLALIGVIGGIGLAIAIIVVGVSALTAWVLMLLLGAVADGLGYPQHAYGFVVVWAVVGVLTLVSGLLTRSGSNG